MMTSSTLDIEEENFHIEMDRMKKRQTFSFGLLQLVVGEVDQEANGRVRVIFLVVVDERRLLLRSVQQRFHDAFLVALRPHSNGQFRYFDLVVADDRHFTADGVSVRVQHLDRSVVT